MIRHAFVIWAVDVLLKVFPAALPPEIPENEISISCACNEYESAQFAFRAEGQTMHLRVWAERLSQKNGEGMIPAENVRCYFQGSIFVQKNTPSTPADELIFKAPGAVPDVLREDAFTSVPPNCTTPVWIKVFVPKGTPAGDYRGKIHVEADGRKKTMLLRLKVYDFTLPDERHLMVTNWFNTGNIAKAHNVKLWSDDFFTVLSAYAKNMAEHRQNVFLISPWTVKTVREEDGTLTFDYSIFDRFVQTFLDAGVRDGIEISHVAHHGEGGWSSKEITLNNISATDRKTGESVRLEPEEGLGPFLTALQNHLEERGWLARSTIHVCDEPSEHNFADWKKASEFIHRFAPKIRRIDAIEAPGFEDLLEVWVPKLNHLRNWHSYFESARKNGAELWYYICLHPTGVWMNRFLDYPLMKVRLLHWLNYRYDLAGYLHWGLNFWGDNPFGTPRENLPPGDTHVIYPGPHGPLNSIRWETQLDSLEDYEYLRLLEKKTVAVMERLGKPEGAVNIKARSRAYSRRIVRTFVDFERDAKTFRNVRDELAKEIEQTDREPLILFDTLPSQDKEIVPSPLSMILEGVTRPGSKVSVNGRDVDLAEDGTFRTLVRGMKSGNAVEVSVERDGKTKTVRREYGILK